MKSLHLSEKVETSSDELDGASSTRTASEHLHEPSYERCHT